MSVRHRNRILAPSSLLVSYLASAASATFTNDFSAYPAASRSCLDIAAAASGCTGDTVTEMNHCLCGNGGNFVLATAACVAKTAKDQVDDVYEMLLTSCTDTKTPLGVSQAQFLDAGSSTTTLSTSTTSTTTATSMTTYKSVANGVTVTVTRGVESVPTGTGKGSSNSDSDTSSDDSDGPKHTVLAAGLVGGMAVLLAALGFMCYRRRRQRKERVGQTGTNGKFAALSSATSLTTITNSPPQGPATPGHQHNASPDRRPDTANAMQMAAGNGQWHQQQQQNNGQLSPQYWQQQNVSNQYGQSTGTWPSPVTSSNGPTGTWGVSPVSQYPHPSSHGSPSQQQGTWNSQAVPTLAPVPASIPYPSTTSYSPVFELPGDETRPVEADSTPIGPAQPVPTQASSSSQSAQLSHSIQSTPHQQSLQPMQPAPAHHGMPRQVDDALQISQVELPPPRYTGPSQEWVSEDKKFG